MDQPPGVLARHPTRSRDRHSPVDGHGRLVDDEGTCEGLPGAPRLVLSPCLEPVVELDLDAERAKPLEPTRRLRVRVEATGDDPCDAGLCDRVNAGRRLPVMGARLHGHVERRPASATSGGGKRHELAVAAAVRLGDTFSND